MSLLQLLGKVVYEKKHYLFYRYDLRQGAGEPYDEIRVYGSYKEIPHKFREVAIPSRSFNVMYYRLKLGYAKLLCYSDNNHMLKAYGWIQSWRPFKHKFRMLAVDGIMLGPYWTAPKHRGKGIYGKLLKHSLFLCQKEKPILIYTTPDNISSQRGVLKAGFEPYGEWIIKVCFRCSLHALRLDAMDRVA